MTVAEARFRRVLAHLAGGVAVVTSVGPEGGPRGLTATAVCSVSLDPPLVLASIDRSSRTHRGIEASGVYGVNLLGARQEALAVRFARDDREKFRGLETLTEATGAPLLEEAPAYLDCSVAQAVTAGDHTIFVGRVEAAAVRGKDTAPLVYHLGRYTTLSPGELPESEAGEGSGPPPGGSRRGSHG